LKLRNQGEPSTDGGPRGDFYCVISVEEHKIFTRKGRDLLVDCRISPAEAALGCEKRIPTLDGSEKLVVPKGAQPGDIVKIRGKGVPEAGRPDAFGDILVKIVVDIPEEALGTRKGTLGRTPQTARRRCAEGRRGHLHEDPRVVRLRNAMPDNDTTPHDDPIPGSGTPPKADTPASDATEGGTTPEAGADGEATSDDAATAEAFAQIAELAKKAEERDRLFEQLQRLNAEFQNFRGRTAKEKADERRYAVRDVMRNLLPALDNLERALSTDATADPASLIEGVRMTADQFRAGLESTGMKRVQAEGSLLDPRCMDAVFKVETSDRAPNTVVAVFEHGYLPERPRRASGEGVRRGCSDRAAGRLLRTPMPTLRLRLRRLRAPLRALPRHQGRSGEGLPLVQGALRPPPLRGGCGVPLQGKRLLSDRLPLRLLQSRREVRLGRRRLCETRLRIGRLRDVNAEAPRCPTCRGPLPPRDAVENGGRRDAPFCSERCRMVDLGRWLTGSFRIAGDPIDPSELPDAPGEPRS
jgi:molecular chaperone GrpE (heat shock protein)/endogenous inhibitor of DNA gyrase (YacG/DUF329 family)